MTMYATENFKSKAALKRAVAEGKKIGVYSPGMGTPVDKGQECLSGPWYPEPHKWYATVTLENGIITKVK